MDKRFAQRGGQAPRIDACWLILLVVISLVLAGCYGVAEDVIPPEQATTRAGLPGRYLPIEGGRADPKEWVRVEAIPGSRDYRLEKPQSEETQVTTLRLLPLNETIWLAQIAQGGKSDRSLIFMRFLGERVHVLISDATDDELRALANSHDVTGQGIMGGFFMRGGTLAGDPADILALMRALAEGPMMMSGDYYQIR